MTDLTPEKRETFLARLAAGDTVKRAAEAIGLTRQRMYQLREEQPDFATDWAAAVDEGTEVLEQEAFRRAVNGVDRERGVYFMGNRVGDEVETHYSDTLLIFLLKARRPDAYRENARVEHTGAGGGPIETRAELSLSDRAERLAALFAQVAKRTAEGA